MKELPILYLFYYPLIMGIIWSIGGLIFYIRREKNTLMNVSTIDMPFVSILIPTYNEEETIEETVVHCSNIKYPHFEIIVVNDGSKDRTMEILKEMMETYPNLRVVNLRENRGKANALKQGVLVSKGEFIAAIDSDAILDQDALLHIMPHFLLPNNGERVGAVTGNPRIRNRSTLLAKIQLAEYASIIGLIKRTQRILGKVMTVSGVFVVFRKKALLDVGMWDTDLITDDIGITWKLQRRFWDIRYEPKALCWMLVPETLKGIWKQRSRWTQGGIEVVLRHKDIFLDWRQRRLYPVYMEQLLSIIWAFTWFICTLVAVYNLLFLNTFSSPLLWMGNYLSIICIIQFLVALMIEKHYEKNILKYLIWTIWYPLIYWHIAALLVIFSFPKGLKILRKSKNEFATWESPDRGFHLKN
ncbi:poly-beta-1,6-N-acetyl-D-glucosamine synthase [Cytobacillus sp. FJAT-53684]|uniref:Poly-beta-1,6-N-acetyl-D-glucosamine synthase n=1 Tax=Cytobacillus mangrovibacter TaxID=3299024 RepID=A0ABW6JV59_9BACI